MFVTITDGLQLSVAVGAVNEVTVHSSVKSAKGVASATGAVMSFIITFWVCVLVFPFPSSYVQVTTVVPWVVTGNEVIVVPVIVPSQLSVAVGAVGAVTAHSSIKSARGSINGPVWSS